MTISLTWPAVAAARRHDAASRLPWLVDGQTAGSVHRGHLSALRAWPRWLEVSDEAVHTLVPGGPPRDNALAQVNRALHAQGLVRGWREETYTVTSLDSRRVSSEVLTRIERAASRFWGTLTLGAHATGYVADASGSPTHLWIARRSLTKATDPGLLDNLVGGGVADGQSPWEALVREGWEEAGLTPVHMTQAKPGRIIRLHRDVAEGLQLEDIYSHDLLMPPGLSPNNQDGEVAGFECLPVQEALSRAASDAMSVDASLVTLDFALRHGLCCAPPGALQLMRNVFETA